jgi:ABC-type lipoprotein release transport system permease subunit
MNPLSLWTYYRRHKGRAALLLGLISLVTAGLYVMGALTWGIFTEPTRANNLYLSRMNFLLPAAGHTELDPSVVTRIRTHPAVEAIYPTHISKGVGIPEAMGGQNHWISLLALEETAIPTILERCDATLVTGRALEPGTAGVMLSNKVAAALDLSVGDHIDSKIDPERYAAFLEPLEVVGILESEIRLGVISYEYLRDHELYREGLTDQFVILARPGAEEVVDDLLLEEIQTTRSNALTYNELKAALARDYQRTLVLAVPVGFFGALAVTLVIAVVNRMALSERLPELGILQATGHSKRWLTRRLAMETAVMALAGWITGLLLSHLVLALIDLLLFAPRGHDLTITLAPFSMIIFIPVAVILYTVNSARRILDGLDAVSIVERGEHDAAGTQGRRATSSRPRPLSSLTYLVRHKRRTILLAAAMSLVIAAVALLIFVMVAVFDAGEGQLGDLRQMSVVTARGGAPLDPGVVTLLGTHPEVDRLIPFVQYWMLDVYIPPFSGYGIGSYGLYQEDLQTLVALYDLKLAAGHLPRSHSNEVVIPQALAQNRDLKVGDVVGNPDEPAYPGASSLPTEFVISGILAESPRGEQNWFSFISLEFLESHEAFDIPADFVYPRIVVPAAGRKEPLDDWLENELAGPDVLVRTYRQQAAQKEAQLRDILVTVSLLEVVFTLVTAIALAILNQITVSQRRSELGVLSALGQGTRSLVGRVLRETALTTGVAWVLGAVLCLAAMLTFQAAMFAPLGLKVNLTNPTPWLYTLPTPAVVLAVTGTTVARTLSRIDTVSIIERR